MNLIINIQILGVLSNDILINFYAIRIIFHIDPSLISIISNKWNTIVSTNM